jgi:error-prone DNA polymerase
MVSMPEAALTPERRRAGPGVLPPPEPAPFVELGLVSCFSFLRGASDALDLATTARALGYDALGIADANTMAGVVRLHTEARALGLRPVIGCRIETVEGLTFLAYPRNRAAYGRLCRLISAGRMARLDGEWQDKGVCDISLAMLAGHAEGVHLVLVPPRDLEAQFAIAGAGNVVALDGSRREQVLRGPLAALLPHLAARLPIFTVGAIWPGSMRSMPWRVGMVWRSSPPTSRSITSRSAARCMM